MPLSEKAKLAHNALDLKSIEQKPTRNGYGEGLSALGEENPNIVALSADLSESTRTSLFQEKFPERYFEMGVAEQNMASVASGLASAGKIPFIASYAMFSPGRNWEQIRTTICYNDRNVKIAGAHAGVSVGPDGATHQAVEDVAIMRVIPNITVVVPCDVEEARKATYASGIMRGPAYLRYAREKTPVFTTEKTPFEAGKAVVFWEELVSGKPDAAIVACGPLVHNALLAADNLEKRGIGVRVINCPFVKPLDENTLTAAALEAGAVVTVEEHQIAGGMGSAVAEFLASSVPVPIEFIGVRDRFGESGGPNDLIERFGMGVSAIEKAVLKVLARKKETR